MTEPWAVYDPEELAGALADADRDDLHELGYDEECDRA